MEMALTYCAITMLVPLTIALIYVIWNPQYDIDVVKLTFATLIAPISVPLLILALLFAGATLGLSSLMRGGR